MKLGVVVGCPEQVPAPAVAGEQQRGLGLGGRSLPDQQPLEILVGGVGVADVELHRRADLEHVVDGDGAGLAVAAQDLADEEVAGPELGLSFVDHPAQMQAAAVDGAPPRDSVSRSVRRAGPGRTARPAPG